MERKFTMGLVWHNCYWYPPREESNNDLYATDGETVFRVEYSMRDGWHVNGTYEFLSPKSLHKYWWADMKQTVLNELRFKEQ